MNLIPKRRFMIDASLLKISDCDYQVFLTHNRGLTTELGTFKMHYGTAFHKFLSRFYTGLPFAECFTAAIEHYSKHMLAVPPEDFRTINHLLSSMDAYAKYYARNGVDLIKTKWVGEGEKREPLIELPFALPYYADQFVEIVLCGTMDMVAEYADCKDVVVDHKTTSVGFYQAQKYLESYELDIQGKFYPWISKTYRGLPYYPPLLINGIFLQPERASKDDDKSKRKFNTGGYEKKSTFSGVNFLRSSLIEFSDEAMDKFAKWVSGRVQRIIKNHVDGEWPENHSRCDTKYGPCAFRDICRRSESMREEIIVTNYTTREYNPLEFQA